MLVPQEVWSPQELCFQWVSAILEEMASGCGNVSVGHIVGALKLRFKSGYFGECPILTDICMLNCPFDGANTGWSNEREGF